MMSLILHASCTYDVIIPFNIVLIVSAQTCEGMLMRCKLYSRGYTVKLHPLRGMFAMCTTVYLVSSSHFCFDSTNKDMYS